MASSASVARPYAQAVFELASEQGNPEEWSSALTSLSAVAGDDAFAALLDDPRVSNDQLTGLLTDVVSDGLPDGGENLVRLLVRNGRVEALPDISRQFDLRVADANKSVNAQVISARELNEDQRNRLSEALEARLGCSVSLEEEVDADLLGGAIVKAGDLVIDGSAAGRIKKLGMSLAR